MSEALKTKDVLVTQTLNDVGITVDIATERVVRCKDCKKHNKEVCIDVPYKDEACPLISWRGKAQGHEYDYQYCPYGERKE